MILKATAKIPLIAILILCSFGSAGAAEQPSVLVQTESLKKAPLPATLTCYGVVHADTRKTVNIGFPRAGEISQLMVRAGSVVEEGTPLLEFRTAPADAMEYRKAVVARDFARSEVQRTENLVKEHLATNSQLASARKDLADAEALLQAQRELGKDRGIETVSAPFDGIVTDLKVNQGDRVQSGTTVLQLAHRGALQADLGAEPEDVTQIDVDMPVSLASVFDPSQMAEGRVTAVQGIVNPQTRLVDVLVEMTSGGTVRFLPGMQVVGRITLGTHTYWVVPRSAVLRDDKGAYIFQVEQGKAHRVEVQISRQTDQLTAIEGDFIPELKVVVQGNYQLQDGMAVRKASE